MKFNLNGMANELKTGESPTLVADKTAKKHIYYPSLDTLRAIAIIMVIISHWLPYYHPLNTFLPLGPMGVTLFFVLSGFLITGILLNEKTKKDLLQRTSWQIFKSFYFKRSIRIFPLYYLTLVVLLLMNVPNMAKYWGWHFGYASNFLFYLEKSFTNDYVAPLWSLSVEEQFYFIWPFAILFSSRRYMLVWLVLAVVSGTAFRMLPANFTDKPFSYLQFLTPACIDCFAVGGLIAYIQYHYPEKLNNTRKNFVVIVIVVFYVLMRNTNEFIKIVFNRNMYACIAGAYILLMITKNETENIGYKILEFEPLVFIG
jgi:peptidoglycan/LPS O-acetylase OafA/YrhL